MSDDRTLLEVGPHRVALAVPPTPPDSGEQQGRLYFWWGLTAAALALARELAGRAELAGARVVELGCGLGLPGVVAGLQGAYVTFTDAQADALAYARRSAVANGLPPERTAFAELDWERPGAAGRFDYVVGSEILYDYNMHRSQLELLEGLLAPGGTILLADRRRRAVERFFGRLRDRGFGGPTTEHSLAPPGEPAQQITVFAWTRDQVPRAGYPAT